ncbi:MAG: hypothetical protein M1840_007326 [Geoglossum simile]|nr:MAG: hypothetical protein M1840_007326 [Geoglossum simile]
MSVIAITLSISIVVFILLSVAIIFCLRFRQKYLINAYRRRNNNTRLAPYPGGHVWTPDQVYGSGQQAVFEKTDSLGSHATTKLPRFSKVIGPPSWNGSLELHHHPQLGGDANHCDSVMVAMAPRGEMRVPEGQPSKPLTWSRPLRRGASFPVAQFNKIDPFCTPDARSPVLRSTSTPLLRTTTTAQRPYGPHPPRDENKKDSPDTDRTSVTEWPSATLEPTPDVPKKPNREGWPYGRRRSMSSVNSLASIINLAMRGPTSGRNSTSSNNNEQRLQRQPSTSTAQSRPPGMAPESPVPPVPAKPSDHNNRNSRHDIFSMRRRESLGGKDSPLPHCLESFSSLQTTSSSILEAIKYTNSGTHPPTFPSSPPNFSSSPLSSRTSSGPSTFDGMTTDFGTPPVIGLTSPSVARLHRKQLSYGASQNSSGRGSHGLRQSVSYGGRMLREGSLTSLATLGRPWKESGREGDIFHFSSSPPGGVPLPSSPNFACANGTPHSTITSSSITPPREPDGPLNQKFPTRFTLTSHMNIPEFPSPTPWADAATPTDSSSNRHSHLYWDPRPSPKGPRQPPPAKKGHRRQNCIRISYDPMEPSTPQQRTLLSPIASVSDHHPTSTPRPPSSSTFSTTLVEDRALGTTRKTDTETMANRLEPTQSEADLRDSPTLAMVNYYSLSPSPTQNHSSPTHPSWCTSVTPSDNNSNTTGNEDISLTPPASSRGSITPPQLKSLKEPSPPPTHKGYIPFSSIATSQGRQSQKPVQPQTQARHLRFSVLALRRMNSEVSTSTTATTAERIGEWGYLNLGGSATTAAGIANTTNATNFGVMSANATKDSTSDAATKPGNTRPISQGPSLLEDEEEPPRKIARVCSTTAAAAVGRRRRMTIGAPGVKGEKEKEKGKEKVEESVIVGLGVGIEGEGLL